jgi:predicted nucleotidyltransferase component of viral defense system
LIPRADIVAWRAQAPWISDAQVEQDLLISRSLVALFSNRLVAENLALRGGTALHKLFLQPASRYSEDIDLVQTKPTAIGPALDAIREVLDGFLGKPSRKQKQNSVTLTYRVESEVPPIVPLRLKVEISTREHFTVLGFHQYAFAVESRWFSGTSNITTYQLNELLGTKLRALYQRRKGRDLFDLWLGLTLGKANPQVVVQSFQKHIAAMGLAVSRDEFRKNLALKIKNKSFLGDIESLLRPKIAYNAEQAYQLVQTLLVDLL